MVMSMVCDSGIHYRFLVAGEGKLVGRVVAGESCIRNHILSSPGYSDRNRKAAVYGEIATKLNTRC